MTYNWIEFTDPAPTGREELYTSLSPDGRMVLAAKTYEALGSPQQVVLLFDPDRDVIGVRPGPKLAANAFTVLRNNKGHSRLVFITRFIPKHDLRLDSTVRFPAAHIHQGDLVLDLHTRVPVGRKRARR